MVLADRGVVSYLSLKLGSNAQAGSQSVTTTLH